MSPVMFILGALIGLAIGYVTIRLKTQPTPQVPPYRIASGVNGTYEFVYDQTYIGDLLVRDVCGALGMPEDRYVHAEVDFAITPPEDGARLTVKVKATKKAAA
jgi:hypothetical protein